MLFKSRKILNRIGEENSYAGAFVNVRIGEIRLSEGAISRSYAYLRNAEKYWKDCDDLSEEWLKFKLLFLECVIKKDEYPIAEKYIDDLLHKLNGISSSESVAQVIKGKIVPILQEKCYVSLAKRYLLDAISLDPGTLFGINGFISGNKTSKVRINLISDKINGPQY